MNKVEFLEMLKVRLQDLPQDEIDRSVMFYDEMIEDRKEDGMSEEEAVTALGNIDAIVEQIMLDRPLPTLMREKIRPKRNLTPFEIALIIVGFPIWFSLLIAFFAVIVAVYVSIWAVIISLYATVLGLAIGGVGGVIITLMSFGVYPFLGTLTLGGSLFVLGVGILMFFPVNLLAVALVKLTGRFYRWVKSLFIKRRNNYE